MKIYMNNQVHPLLRDIINSFAAEASIPVRPTTDFDESDFIKSDYCRECDGGGFVWLHHENPLADSEKEQCQSCEDLHRAEVRADNMMDAWKEGE
jgi:hypothetical protein